jgi:hypothetical protein
MKRSAIPSPPLAGEGQGGGQQRQCLWLPPSPTLPRKGGESRPFAWRAWVPVSVNDFGFNCQTAPARHSFAISPQVSREFCIERSALYKTEGVGNAGRQAAPAASCALEYSQRGRRDHPTFPHAMVYGLYRALLGDRAFLSPRRCRSLSARQRPPHPAPRP